MISPGTRLGPYEILSTLGAGGMGEVYRATDSNLKRSVAIKVLPASVAGDADRLARFQREAEVLAVLNHPNIGAIYGLERSADFTALVMELVEGEDLSQRIARGAIPLGEALPIAKQIAEALEAAHEQGIIHRDLKPANIKVREDGTVKVLDFGLAKALEPADSARLSGATGLTQSPTITTPAMTGIGVILGTAAYMSPEQAKGRPVDKRSDVWAFGCVIYEMLTGKRAFEGDDVSDTLAAVLRAEPDWVALPADLSPSLATLVRRCLDKDRRRRIGDVSTIRFLLDEALAPASPAAPSPHVVVASLPARGWNIARATLLVILAAALGGLVAWNARPQPDGPIVTRFAVALGDGQQFTNLTDLAVALSPDGTRFVYVANRRLYLRSLSDLDAQPLRGTEMNPRRPMFSADGSSLAYFTAEDRAVKRIAVTGGAPVTTTTLDSPYLPFGGTWTGDHMFFGLIGGPDRVIVRVPASGGKAEVIVRCKPDEFAVAPQMLPDGDHLLFTLARGAGPDRWEKAQVVAQSLTSGERRVLVEGGSDGHYIKTGHLLYVLGGVVFAVRFDPQKLRVIGGPVPVLEGVRRTTSGSVGSPAAQFSVSDNGSLVYIAGPAASGADMNTLALLDRKGVAETLKLQPGGYREPRISPDGKQIAFGTDDGKEAAIWVYELSGTTSVRRLTLNARNRYPVWSPDSERIVFQSDREGDDAIFWQRADGNGTVERLTKPEGETAHVPESFSPDGKRLLFDATKGGKAALLVLGLDDRKTTPFGDVQSTLPFNAAFSPDGKWVAYTKRGTSGVSQIYVQTFPPAGQPHQITNRTDLNAHHPFWSRDGRDLYYIPGAGQFAAVRITARPTFSFSDPIPLPRGPLGFVEGGPGNMRQNDAAADGRVIAVVPVGPAPSTNTGGSLAPQIQVVLNWFEEVKARVPTKRSARSTFVLNTVAG